MRSTRADTLAAMSNETTTFTYSRTVNAPRKLAYSVYMQPETLAQFWCPEGLHIPLESVIIEPQPGGRFQCDMVFDDSGVVLPGEGFFVELNPPASFTFTEPRVNITGTLSFEEADGKTTITMHQENIPVKYAGPEAVAGFTSVFDRLEQLLARIQ